MINWFLKWWYRNATLVCMRQENTYIWGAHLGKKTPGVCQRCNAPIFFEEQNGIIGNKICHVCNPRKPVVFVFELGDKVP